MIPVKSRCLHICILLLALVFKTMQVVHWYSFEGDKCLQTAVAKRISDGLGYTYPVLDTGQPEKTIDVWLVYWPPLYSILVSPLISIGLEPVKAALLLDIIAAALCMLGLWELLRRLNTPTWLMALIIFFRANALDAPLTSSTPTDYLSLAMFLGSILLLNDLMTSKTLLKKIFFFTILALLPWLRYANLPLAPLLPLYLIWAGHVRQEPEWKKIGFWSLLIVMISSGILLLQNLQHTGSIFYVQETPRGFFPSNLLYLPSLVFEAVGNPSFWNTTLSQKLGIEYSYIRWCLWGISSLLLLGLAVYMAKQIRKGVTYPVMIQVLALLAVVNTMMLAVFSINRSRETAAGTFWTYIEDSRYHMLLSLLILLLLALEFIRPLNAAKGWRKIIGICLVLVMVSDFLHGFWILRKTRSWSSVHPVELLALNRDWMVADSLVREAGRKSLVITDEYYDLRGYAVINDVSLLSGAIDFRKFDGQEKRTYLLKVTRHHEYLYEWFFEGGKAKELSSNGNIRYYIRKGP